MSDSIHTIVAAGLGRGERAYNHFRESYQPFLRPPFLYFSEKRTRDNLYFHTGAGGCLQSVLYGFGGLRFRSRPAHGRAPPPPDTWKSLEIRRVRWRGRTGTSAWKRGSRRRSSRTGQKPRRKVS